MKYNDALLLLRELQTKEKEWSRDQTRLLAELDSKDKELHYMQDKVDKLSDPIVIKFEKDGLVSTYKKRIQELEEYIG